MRSSRGLLLIVFVVALALLVAACGASGQAAYSDPFGYCKAVGTMDTPDARYTGAKVPDDVAQGLQVDVATVYALTGIPTDVPPDTALKDLEQIVPDFEVSMVRDVLAVYLGESSLEETVSDAAPATPEVRESSTATVEESIPVPPTPTTEPLAAEPVATDYVPLGDGSGEGDGTGAGLDEAGYLAAADIRGQHTLAEIAGRGQIELDQLLAELGLAAGIDVDVPVRDLVKDGVIDEVTSVRGVVEALQQQ